MTTSCDTITKLELRDAGDSALYTFEVDSLSTSKDILNELISQSMQRADDLREQIADVNLSIDDRIPKADKLDYALAASCGLLTGLIDIFLVGKPGESPLGDWTDKQTDKAVKKFADFCGWDPKDGKEDSVKSAMGFLEKKFKINYDQTNNQNGKAGIKFEGRNVDLNVRDLAANNHHMKSLGHSPDIIGLFFSILNQFTNTSTFISRGEFITIDTGNFELVGHTVPAKIFSGFCNWLGHLASDVTGSSGSGGRGEGIPMPFYELFGLMEFGKINVGKDRLTIAQFMTRIFQEGYDFRFLATMAIPVGINEVLIRLIYMLKRRFYHKLSWEDSMPFGNNPTLQRILLVGQGTLEIIDIADAAIRGVAAQSPVEFVLRLNIVGVGRVSLLIFGEVKNDAGIILLKRERSQLVHELLTEQGFVMDCRVAQNWQSLHNAFAEIYESATVINSGYSNAYERLADTREDTDATIELIGESISKLKESSRR